MKALRTFCVVFLVLNLIYGVINLVIKNWQLGVVQLLVAAFIAWVLALNPKVQE